MNKILLVRNDNIGDLICTTPSIEALRKKYLNSRIDIVVNSYNYSAIYKNSFVNKIYCYTKPKHKSNLLDKITAGIGKLKILWQIKQEKYDVVVIFRTNYSKSAELFAKITNAEYKIGVKNPRGKDNFNIHIPFMGNHHEVEFCFNCLKPLNVKYLNEKTYFHIDKKFIKKYIQYKNSIVFHISARIKKNAMSYSKLKNILHLLDKKIIITAEPKDYEIAIKLAKTTKAQFIQTNGLLDLAGLIKNSKLFISLEGGAMHLAPALEVKTIALFGYSNINRWHPWGYKKLVIQDDSKMAENINNKIIINAIRKHL